MTYRVFYEVQRRKLAMLLINKYTKLSSHMASMSINDKSFVKQIILSGLSNAKLLLYGANVVHFQMTTTLLAALSPGAITNFL